VPMSPWLCLAHCMLHMPAMCHMPHHAEALIPALPTLQARSQLQRRVVLPNGVLPASASYQVMCDLPFASGEPSAPGNGSYKLLITPLASGEGLGQGLARGQQQAWGILTEACRLAASCNL
jgi:hypothetical protein